MPGRQRQRHGLCDTFYPSPMPPEPRPLHCASLDQSFEHLITFSFSHQHRLHLGALRMQTAGQLLVRVRLYRQCSVHRQHLRQCLESFGRVVKHCLPP